MALLLAGGTLALLLAHSQPSSPLATSLANPFQWLGAPLKLADRLASRMVPVGSVEERQLGDLYRQRFEAGLDPADPRQAYLDALMATIRRHARRPFPYRAYRIGAQGMPNAYALPGGVIVVSDELLTSLGSEAQLVAVLAHEVGHIELGHCFDTVRFQLLARRSGVTSLGQLADLANRLLLRHNFSKAEEHEADSYAFRLLLHSPYDPSALADSFASLQRQQARAGAGGEQNADLLGDYLRSHAPLPLRQAEFSQEAAAWWQRHPTARRYQGRRNLRRHQPLSRLSLAEEWRRGPSAPR